MKKCLCFAVIFLLVNYSSGKANIRPGTVNEKIFALTETEEEIEEIPEIQVDLYSPNDTAKPAIIIEWLYIYGFKEVSGYNLYKAKSENEALKKVNDSLLKVEAEEIKRGRIILIDTDVIRNVSYSYQIEVIRKDGTSSFSEPISWFAE